MLQNLQSWHGQTGAYTVETAQLQLVESSHKLHFDALIDTATYSVPSACGNPVDICLTDNSPSNQTPRCQTAENCCIVVLLNVILQSTLASLAKLWHEPNQASSVRDAFSCSCVKCMSWTAEMHQCNVCIATLLSVALQLEQGPDVAELLTPCYSRLGGAKSTVPFLQLSQLDRDSAAIGIKP